MPAMLSCFFLVFGIGACLSPQEHSRRKPTIMRNEAKPEDGHQTIVDAAGHMVAKSDPLREGEMVQMAEVKSASHPAHHYERSPTMATVYITGSSGKQLYREVDDTLTLRRTWGAQATWNLQDDGDCLYGDGHCISLQSASNPLKEDKNFYITYDGAGLELSQMTESWRLEKHAGGRIRFRESEDNYITDTNGTLGTTMNCSSICDFKVNVIGIAWGNDPAYSRSKAHLAVCLNRINHPEKHLELADKGLSYTDGECDEGESFTMMQASRSESYFVTSDVHIVAVNSSLHTLDDPTDEDFNGWLGAHPEDNVMTFKTEHHEYLSEVENHHIGVNSLPDMMNERKWEVRLLNLTFCYDCPPHESPSESDESSAQSSHE